MYFPSKFLDYEILIESIVCINPSKNMVKSTCTLPNIIVTFNQKLSYVVFTGIYVIPITHIQISDYERFILEYSLTRKIRSLFYSVISSFD